MKAEQLLILNQLKRQMGQKTYLQGLILYIDGKVEDMKIRRMYTGMNFVDARVNAQKCHLFVIKDSSFEASCDCMHNGEFCRHTAALLIAYLARSGVRFDANEAYDDQADRLLRAYDETAPLKSDGAAFSLLPVLSFENGRASAAFKICGEKSYLIMGMRDFANRIREKIPGTYGGKMRFSHDINDLDLRSQALCRMILDYAEGINALLEGKRRDVISDFGEVRTMTLSGESFDRIFDLFLGEKLPLREGGQRLLVEEEPEELLSIDSGDGRLKISATDDVITYHSGNRGYIIDKRKIRRVSRDYERAMLPLITSLSENGGALQLNRRKAEEFCLSVAPLISDYAGERSLGALKPYMPEELAVRYLLDMPERGVMTCTPDFNYAGRYVSCTAGENDYPDIRRNFPGEKRALEALNEYFEPPKDERGIYTLTDEDKMFELIKSAGGTLNDQGEVFISDRLRRIMNAKPPKPTIRAGVSNGMLNLKLDTDEFPVDELEALMRAVREKRKYYRLEDGSFVNLGQGQYSAFTVASDNLGLNPKIFVKGTDVPLYKALFLDEALKGEKGVSLEKDADYRKLLRDFKTVEDGDFPPPEELENVLRDYQKTGYAWLRTLDKYGFGGILADDMGLGKTLQMLAFLTGIKRDGAEGPTLIACPASVTATWGSEAHRWVPDLKVCLLTGGANERANLIGRANEFDLLVTSYDSLRNDIDSHEKNHYRVIALDEAQYIKNRETKLKKSVDRLSGRTKLALTGTPVENRLSELYSIFEFVMPGYLGSYTGFRQKYETPIAEHSDQAAKDTLTKLVRPFILRRMKRDVLSELPPKTETNCYIQMGEEQRKLYVAYANEVRKKMQSAQPQDKLMILSMLTRLRQICCDPALVYEGYEQNSCKLDECERMVQELIENDHRILLFSQFTSMLDRIEGRLETQGIRCFRLQGDTPLEERIRLVNRFNAGQGSVFLISLKAGGTGINLTGADTVIHYDPWWNIAAQNQATDRCYRIGQERAVQVYKLIASETIEENIVRLQYKKLDLAKVVSENADGGLMHMSSEELLELLK